jgi:hypothetical protein
MAELDKVKEKITSFRLYLSLLLGLEMVLVGAIIARYDAGKLDFAFWMAVDLAIAIPVAILLVFNLINRYTNKMGDL